MSSSRRHICVSLSLTLLTLVCLGKVCSCGFAALDDTAYVIDNPLVYQGLSLDSGREALTSFHAGFWQPLVWLSLQFDASLIDYGAIARRAHLAEASAEREKKPLERADDPFFAGAWIFHATNLLLHLANVLLTYALMYRLTAAMGRSALIAALFAVHPLHVESVAWVAERKDVLSTFFFLLTLLAYVGYARRPGVGRFLLVFVGTLLGLATKAMLVTIPAVLLLLDYWPLGRVDWGQARLTTPWGPIPVVSWKRALLEKAPLLALCLACAIVTLYGQTHARVSLGTLDEEHRLAGAILNYGWYLRKTFWPSDLCMLYLLHLSNRVFGPPVVLLLLLLLGVSAMVITRARRHPQALVGWFWFVGTLVPVIGLVQSGPQAYADRFTYLPHLGLFLWIVWSGGDLLERWKISRPFQVLLCAVTVGALGMVSFRQVEWWQDSVTMMRHCWDLDERNHRAAGALALHYCARGNYDEAIVWGNKALEASSTRTQASQLTPYYFVVGWACADSGRKEQAEDALAKMLRLPPQPDTDLEIATLSFKLGHVTQAEHFFHLRLQRHPDDALARRYLIQLQKMRPQKS